MKKAATIFSISLFLLLSLNTMSAVALEPEKILKTQETKDNVETTQRRFTEGFYNINDLGLMANVTYNVQNVSKYRGFLIVFDSDQKIQQAISLDPYSVQHPLKTMGYDDRIVILGSGELVFL